jgi:hypothetical protein
VNQDVCLPAGAAAERGSPQRSCRRYRSIRAAVSRSEMCRGLAAYADRVGWIRATPNDWITTAALSFIGAGIILHVGIGLRWPFAQPARPQLG